MRYLILSDIHANWEALEAVLQDAEGAYETIVCLGDVVGYGADPNAVTEWVREHVAKVIRGNHDKVCCGLEDPALFNPIAERAACWTLGVLTSENREFLRKLAQGPVEEGGFHGPRGEDRDGLSMRVRTSVPCPAHRMPFTTARFKSRMLGNYPGGC